jgi:hypothetical protein
MGIENPPGKLTRRVSNVTNRSQPITIVPAASERK